MVLFETAKVPTTTVHLNHHTKGAEIMIVDETIRPDGLRVVTGYLPESKRAHMRFICNRGSADDPIGKHGTAHLFEHLVFRGTERRTASEVSLFLKRRALDYGARTTAVDITYRLEVATGRANEALAFLADLYFNPLFSTEDLLEECQLVVKEVKSDLDKEHRRAFGLLRRALWSNHPSVRYTDRDELEQVVSITRDDLLTVHQEWHVPHNTMFVYVGAIEHGEICRLLKTYIPLQQEQKHRPVPLHDDELDLPPRESTIILPWKNRSLTTTIYGCKYPRLSDRRGHILNRFMGEMLFDGAGSRLWNIARIQKPIAYSLDGSIDGRHCWGYACDGRVTSEPYDASAAREALRECMETPFGDPDRETFEGVGELLADIYSCADEARAGLWAGALQDYAEEGDPVLAEKHFSESRRLIPQITMDELEDVRARVFRPERMVTVVIEPEG